MGSTKFNDSSFVVIHGWMINRLKLSGLSLSVYATIYGFSRDKQGVFNGSVEYLAAAGASTRQSVHTCLNQLVERKLITKSKVRNKIVYKATPIERVVSGNCEAQGLFNDSSFVVIHGWMINRLKLSGLSLSVYATIYGFSRDEQGVFNGTAEYLAAAGASTRQGVHKCLNQLTGRGLIIKTKQGKSVFYQVDTSVFDSVILESVNKFDSECKQTLQSGVNKLDSECKQTLQSGVNKLDTCVNKLDTCVNKLDTECKQTLHNNIEIVNLKDSYNIALKNDKNFLEKNNKAQFFDLSSPDFGKDTYEVWKDSGLPTPSRNAEQWWANDFRSVQPFFRSCVYTREQVIGAIGNLGRVKELMDSGQSYITYLPSFPRFCQRLIEFVDGGFRLDSYRSGRCIKNSLSGDHSQRNKDYSTDESGWN